MMVNRTLARLLLRLAHRVVQPTANNASKFLRIGRARADLADFDGACASLSQAIRLKPNLAEAYRVRAAVFLQKQDLERAWQDAKEALRLRPNNAKTHVTYGNVLREMKQYSEALSEYEHALTLDDSDPTFALVGRAHCYIEIGELAKAVDDFRRAIQLGCNARSVRDSLDKTEQLLKSARPS